MGRRHLTLSEAEASLRRGKSVECFLGSCHRNGAFGIQWISAKQSKNGISVLLYESADIGDENFVDIYEFGPLDPELDFEDASEVFEIADFSQFISTLEKRFPGCSSRLVNEFIVQDEYADFVSKGRK